uniref:NUDE domain-containing protein n=1 Tax=Anopheles atroparvus TaxID=41427 RepID=A0A182JK30_ANOAO
MEGKLFTSVEEECVYWKERCLKVSQERDDAQREFDDFTTESRQLEAELEMTVEQQEKKIRDLNQLVNQLHTENESYKRKMQYTENETNKIDADYRILAKENEKLKIYIRELEQKNDDLERANRVASESVAEFESMLNQAYEKNALLELEVDEKERMQIKLQRLMDEARDLKQELKVRTLKPDEQGEKLEDGAEGDGDASKQETASNATTTIATAVTSGTSTQLNNVSFGSASGPDGGTKMETLNNNLNSSKQSPLAKLNDVGRESGGEGEKTLDDVVADGLPKNTLPLSPTSQLIIERNGNNVPTTALVPSAAGSLGGLNAPMAPSDRVSTLNIVADLLRRLDNMEAKLKAWKIHKPSSRASKGPSERAGSATTVTPGGHGTHNHHRQQLHNSQTASNLHHSALGAGHATTASSHHTSNSLLHHHHHHSNSYQSQLHHHADSNLSLNSLGSGASVEGTLGANCCAMSSGNVQLHSYQPTTITIGTQTPQTHQTASSAGASLSPKVELLRTNK